MGTHVLWPEKKEKQERKERKSALHERKTRVVDTRSTILKAIFFFFFSYVNHF